MDKLSSSLTGSFSSAKNKRRSMCRSTDEQWIDLGPTGDGESPRRPLQFRAFRRHFNVTLHPAPDLISPSFTVVVRNGSAGDGEIPTDDPAFLSGCLYNGRAHIRSARRDEIESAAFNLCGRMVIGKQEKTRASGKSNSARHKRAVRPHTTGESFVASPSLRP